MPESLRPGVSRREWGVLQAFWGASAALSVSGLRLALDADWDVASLESMVARLVEKGYLRAQPGSSVGRYSPTLEKREVIREEALRWCEDRQLDWQEVEKMAADLLDARKEHRATGGPGRPE